MSIHPASALLFETRSRPYGNANNINNNNNNNNNNLHLNSTRGVEQLTVTRTVTSNSTENNQHKTTTTTTESSRLEEAERHRKRKTIVVDATFSDQVDQQQSGATSGPANGGGGGGPSRLVSISANGRGPDKHIASSSSSSPSPSSNSTATTTTTTSRQNLTKILGTASNNNSSAYSDLLRYRSQEFFHRLQPVNGGGGGGANKPGDINCPAAGQLRSRELSLIDLSQVGLQHNYHRHPQQQGQPQHYYHNQPNQYYPVITNSLLVNATLGRRVTGDTAKKNLNGNNNNLGHYSSQQFLQQQPPKPSEYQHHPHYTNHLFQRNLPGTGNNSINRSNSSLSLNHNLLQQLEAKRSAYLNSRSGGGGDYHHRNYHLTSSNNVSEIGGKLSQVSSAASTVSCCDQSNEQSIGNQTTTTTSNNMSNSVSGAASATPTRNPTTAAYYNKMNGQPQQQLTPSKVAPPSTTTASMMMLGTTGSGTSNTRTVLTRSSSSDPRSEPPAMLSTLGGGGKQHYQLGPQQPIYHNYHFLMPNGTTHTISGAGALGSSSPSSSSSSYGYGHGGGNAYNSPSRTLQPGHHQHQGASMSLMTQSAYGSIGYSATATNNNNATGNRLPSSKESSPTKLSVLGKQTSLGDNSSTTSTAAGAAASGRFPVFKQPQQIASAHYSQQHQQKAKTIDSRSMVNYPTSASSAGSANKNNNNNNGSSSHFAKNLFGGDGGGGGNTSNLFDAKKNKLFGSVSSIVDIQCLKDSQKVSVIERKTSRLGRSLKSTSGSTASSFFKLFTSSSSSSSSSNSANATASNGGQGGGVAGGNKTSTTLSSATLAETKSELIIIDPLKIRSQSTASNNSSGSTHDARLQQRLATMAGSGKSASLDSANVSPATAATVAAIDLPLVPASEIFFRKYFTFYDLMSATSYSRLFVDCSTACTTTTTPLTSITDVSAPSTNTNGPVTTFESSTMSSTSSYSSCNSSVSKTNYQQQRQGTAAATTAVTSSADTAAPLPAPIGNDLLSPSPNFLNEIGSERQYSIELRLNNGFREEVPSEVLSRADGVTASAGTTSNSATTTTSGSFHTPSFSKRINIFSDASPFAALLQHSVMSDLYGTSSSSTSTGPGHQSNGSHSVSSTSLDRSKSKLSQYTGESFSFEPFFSDHDDGFGSLSSTSLTSYPVQSANGAHHHTPPATGGRCTFSPAAEHSNILEMDYGSNFYRTHFRGNDHQNWLQIHEKYGPIVVSLRKERVKNSSGGSGATGNGNGSSAAPPSSTSSSSSSSSSSTRWRVIVRTTSLISLRGTVSALPSICLPGWSGGQGQQPELGKKGGGAGGAALQLDNFNINSVKDVLSLVVPRNCNVANFRLAAPTAVSVLLRLDEISQNTEYKIGVLYAYGRQHSEEEFYNNILDYESSKESSFYQFLNLISHRVRLKEFKGYKAGLDVNNDTTGEYSWTSKFGHVDIMFHVCTELPFTETNRQQLPRKRHIGNDIVTIVFLHENFTGPPFTPALIRSKFQQVFIIIKPIEGGQYYRVTVARHKLVPLFGPPLKPYYSKAELKEFILTKIINAENACHSVNKFAEMAKRTRNEYLTELCAKHSTTQTVQHVDSSATSNSLNSFKKLFGGGASSNSSVNSTASSVTAATGDGWKRSKDALSALVAEPLGVSTSLLGPFGGGGRHILNGIKDPPTLLGGVLFSSRCAGSPVPARLYVHDFHANVDVEVEVLLSNEAIILIDARRAEVIWAAPVTSIIGWTDSSGVFAAATPVGDKCNSDQQQQQRLMLKKDMRTKSMDSAQEAASSLAAKCSRDLRLYYHQGECIQIMQRPVPGAAGSTASTGHNSITNCASMASTTNASKHNKKAQAAAAAIAAADYTRQQHEDPFLAMVRILELITRKSELREIVIKRKAQPLVSSRAALLQSDSTLRCGGSFGFLLNMSTGIIEDIMDQALAAYGLTQGCKVLEIAKISFAAMTPDELSELLNQSVIICLTYTEFDYFRTQPRCQCAWPQAKQQLAVTAAESRSESERSPVSEYENLPLNSGKTTPGKFTDIVTVQQQQQQQAQNSKVGPNNNTSVKTSTIHITHVTGSANESQQPQQPAHNVLLNVSSSSTSSSYYSAGHSSPGVVAGAGVANNTGLYPSRSSNNIASQQQQQLTTSNKATNASGMTTNGKVSRSRSNIAAVNGKNSLADNLIKLLTMDSSLDDTVNEDEDTFHKRHNTSATKVEIEEDKVIEVPNNYNNKEAAPTGSADYSVYYHYNPAYQQQQQQQTNASAIRVQPSSTAVIPTSYYQRAPHASPEDFLSYTSSHYSSASSTNPTPYSSLGRSTGSGNNGSVQLVVNNSSASAAPIISGQHMLVRANGPNSKVISIGENVGPQDMSADCYLLTAQPVRVDNAAAGVAAGPATQQGNAGPMSNSFDSLINSAMGFNSTPPSVASMHSSLTSDTLCDIVWPSMLSNSDNNSPTSSLALSTTPGGGAGCPPTINNSNIGAPDEKLTEKVRKLSLDNRLKTETIMKLKEENERLHQQSQSASQQLRRLTEWFFNSPNGPPSAAASTTTGSGTSTTSNGISSETEQQQQHSIAATTSTTSGGSTMIHFR